MEARGPTEILEFPGAEAATNAANGFHAEVTEGLIQTFGFPFPDLGLLAKAAIPIGLIVGAVALSVYAIKKMFGGGNPLSRQPSLARAA